MMDIPVADLRARLLAARGQHVAALETFKADLAGETERSYDDEQSNDDDLGLGGGTSLAARHHSGKMAEIAAGMIEQIDFAILRLDRGLYGLCFTCGAQIESERLEALPTTWRCSTCAQQPERVGSSVPTRQGDRAAPLFSPSDSPVSPSWKPLPPDSERYERIQSWPAPITGPPSKLTVRSKPKEPGPGAHIWQERAHGLREVTASDLGVASAEEAKIREAYAGFRSSSITYNGLRTESTIEYWKTHKDPKRVTPLVQPADLYRHEAPSSIDWKWSWFDWEWAAEEDSDNDPGHLDRGYQAVVTKIKSLHLSPDEQARQIYALDQAVRRYRREQPKPRTEVYLWRGRDADLDDRPLWERQTEGDALEVDGEIATRRAEEAAQVELRASVCRKCKTQMALPNSEYCDYCLCVDCPSDDRQPIKYLKLRLCPRCHEYRRTHKGQPRPIETQRGRKKVHDEHGS